MTTGLAEKQFALSHGGHVGRVRTLPGSSESRGTLDVRCIVVRGVCGVCVCVCVCDDTSSSVFLLRHAHCSLGM